MNTTCVKYQSPDRVQEVPRMADSVTAADDDDGTCLHPLPLTSTQGLCNEVFRGPVSPL